MDIFLIITIAVLFLFAVYLIAEYNGLVKLKVRSKEAWSDIDIQLKRRYNLIPNLLETVKGYACHEKEVFQKVTEARANAIQATKPEAKAKAENVLSESLKSLFAVSENYPTLKASDNFLELQRELTDTEDKIQASRRFYNANVRDLNIKVSTFPSNLIASLFHFKKKQMFELSEEDQRSAPQIKF